MAEIDPAELELTLNRFNRLIRELLEGAIERNAFQPWEVEILLDVEKCGIDPRRRWKILAQYRGAVERQLHRCPGPPMKLSEYLEERNRKRADRAHALK